MGEIDCSGREIPPEQIDQTTFQRAGAGEQRSGRCAITGVRCRAGLGPKSAGLAHHAPRFDIAVDWGAPMNAAHLHLPRQHEAVLGIEDGDELWHQAQGWIAPGVDMTGSDSFTGQGKGGREVAAGAEIDLAVDAQLIESRIVPMRKAVAADPQGHAVREAQAGKNPADQVVAGASEGGLGDGCSHRDHSATGGRRRSPTLKPVTESPARLFLWRVPNSQDRHPNLGFTPLPCPASR